MPFKGSQKWRGYYVFKQGKTSLELKIQKVSGVQIEAIFDFNFRRGGATGQFFLHGQYQTGSRKLIFTPGKWIKNPKRYRTVGMDGKVSHDGKSYSGTIKSPGCGEFELSLVSLVE